MRKKFFSIVAIILCCSLIFSACGKHSNKSYTKNVSQEDANLYKLNTLAPSVYSSVNGLTLEPGTCISIIGRFSNDSYWKQIKAGAEQAITELNNSLGYTGKDKITLTFKAPGTLNDINEQVNILDEEVARNPVAICISAIDPDAFSIQFDLAAESDIPIITFDSSSNYQNIGTHISTDNTKASETAAKELAQLMEESGEVAIFVQNSLSSNSKQRLQGFLDTIHKSYPEISVANTYYLDEFDAMSQVVAAEKNISIVSQDDVISYILEKNPNLKGVYTTDLDTTQLVANALRKAKRTELAFIGFDGGPEQIQLIKDGVVNGLIIQNPYAMGYAIVVASTRLSLGLGNASFVNSGSVFVTKENMSSDSIVKMLY